MGQRGVAGGGDEEGDGGRVHGGPSPLDLRPELQKPGDAEDGDRQKSERARSQLA